MTFKTLLERLRYYAAVIGFGLGAAIFWGTVAAVAAKLSLDLEEMHAWLFVGLPIALLFLLAIWRKLPGLLGLDEE